MDPLWPPEPCMESFANLLAPAEQVPPCPISLTMPAVPQGCSLAPQGLPQGPGWLSLRTPPALTAFAVGESHAIAPTDSLPVCEYLVSTRSWAGFPFSHF